MEAWPAHWSAVPAVTPTILYHHPQATLEPFLSHQTHGLGCLSLPGASPGAAVTLCPGLLSLMLSA